MPNRRSISGSLLLGALLTLNGALFLATWYMALKWQSGGIVGLAIAGGAAGLTLGQFLVIALRIALHPNPSPRHWLWGVFLLVAASLTFCSLQMLFDPWIEDSESFLRVLLARQIPALLSLTAVGILMLLLIRVAVWPLRRLAATWLADVAGPLREKSPQYSLAEIFLITAGIAVACWLGRSLFDASLADPLIQGATLVIAAFPTAVFAISLSRQRSFGRNLGLACAWAIAMSLLLMPLVAFANENLGLLASWTRWRPLNPWSFETLATSAAFTSAAAVSARSNWVGLTAFRYGENAMAPAVIAARARLTPPASPR